MESRAVFSFSIWNTM
ncbi:hypothetical protein V3C99_000962, partial [Haemonchus contortus]